MRHRAAPGSERGNATVLLLGLLGLGVVLVLGLARLGAAAVARAHADTAAEFGALAAADQIALGAGTADACAAARVTVVRNQARMVACRATPSGARVEVVRGAHGLVARGHARATIDSGAGGTVPPPRLRDGDRCFTGLSTPCGFNEGTDQGPDRPSAMHQ